MKEKQRKRFNYPHQQPSQGSSPPPTPHTTKTNVFLRAINYALFPLRRRAGLAWTHICYHCLLIWPESTCHAPSNMGTGHLGNTREILLCAVPAPPRHPPPTCVRGRKSPASHESNAVTVLVLRGGGRGAPLSVCESGGMRRPKAYISVDGEINQIISGVRKGAQREPSWSLPFEM